MASGFAAFLNDLNGYIALILPIPLIVINVLVLWLSIWKVKSSLSRTFTLNMSIPSLGYSLYLTIVKLLNLLKITIYFEFRTRVGDAPFLDYFTDFIYYLCTYEYRMLAILIIFLTYLSFARPTFYRKNFYNRNILILFAIGHVCALISSVAGCLSVNRAALKYVLGDTYTATTLPFSVFEITAGCVDFFTFFILVAFYVVSVQAIIRFNYRNSQISSSAAAKKRQVKAQLFATLAYITPPSIFLIPNSFCPSFFVSFLTSDVIVMDHFCEVKIRLFSGLLLTRLFLASAMVIVAFGDYRRAILKLLVERNVLFKKTNAIKDTNTMIGMTNHRPTN